MFKGKFYLLTALVISATVLLSACGTTPTPTTAPATQVPTAMMEATDTPAAAMPSGMIAILLPETKTARYESQDLPSFKKTMKEGWYFLIPIAVLAVPALPIPNCRPPTPTVLPHPW